MYFPATMNANRIMMAILVVIALLIPLMWVLGHRANNSLLFFLIIFALFKSFSRSFSDSIDAVVVSVAASIKKSKRIILSLVAIELLLIVLHLVNHGQYHFWDVNREEGVATLVAALLLAMNALVVSVCWKQAAARSDRWKWLLVGVLFGGIAFDELSEMHDWVPRYLYHLFGGEGDFIGGGFTIWVIVLSPVIVAVVISLLWFFFRVLNRASQTWALAALSCWLIVLVIEFFGKTSGIHWVYGVAVEEFLEMLGSTLFLTAFLTHLRHLHRS